MATYGEGDPTDNAIEFVEWIKDKDRDLDNDSLKNAHFSEKVGVFWIWFLLQGDKPKTDQHEQ